MLFEWFFNKNEKIKQERGVSFEKIILAIAEGQLLIEFPNERYANQKIIVVNINNYAWVVPTEQRGDKVRLITAFPRRKYTEEYL